MMSYTAPPGGGAVFLDGPLGASYSKQMKNAGGELRHGRFDRHRGKGQVMLEKAGKNSGDNRRDNRGLVLRMVATGACRTRRDLVVRTGLSKMTISNIVGEMIDGDVLRESEVVCSEEPGRNPVRLRLSPEAPKAAGVAFLPGRCESVLCGLDLRVFRRAGTDLPKDAPDLLQRPGGEQMCPSESVRPAVRERYGLPVFLEDTCQSALLVESLFGRARNCRDVLFVSLGDRVGSAVLSGGQLCRGRGGRPLGLGHVTICAGGRPCRCGGRGCLELYVRSPEVLKKLYHRTGLEASYADFCRITGSGEVDRVFRETVDFLAAGIASALNLLNSELVLLGGDGLCWTDRHVADLESAIARLRPADGGGRVLVRKPRFLGEGALLGAACGGIARIFSGELPLQNG